MQQVCEAGVYRCVHAVLSRKLRCCGNDAGILLR
jgi:hypothetical protein